MQKKKSYKRPGTLNKFFLLIALVIGVLSAYYIVKKKGYIGGSRSNQAKMGILGDLKKDVRRKAMESYRWVDVTKPTEVFEGDSVFTGDDSEAVAYLSDGIKLVIEPNSLIVLQKNKSKLILNLKAGQLVAENLKTKSKIISLLQNGKKADVQLKNKESFQLTKTLKGSLDISTKSGSIAVMASGVKTRVLPDEKLKISPQFKVVKHKVKIKLMSPVNKKIVLQTKKKHVSFLWKSAVKASMLTVDVSTDSSFKNIVFSKATSKSRLTATKALPVGTNLYWRVRTGSKNVKKILESKTASFTVYNNRPPTLQSPENGESIEIDKLQKIIDVDFFWKEVAGAPTYLLQISKTADFKSLISQQVVEEVYYEKHPLVKGDYFWRVRAQWGQKSSGGKFSGAHKLYVRPKGSVAPVIAKAVVPKPKAARRAPAPKKPRKELEQERHLLEGAENSLETKLSKKAARKVPVIEKINKVMVINFGGYRGRNFRTAEKKIKNPPQFKWRPIKKTWRYKIQIATDKSFNNLVVNKLLKATKYTWTNLRPGQYYYKVAALRAKQDKSYVYTKHFGLLVMLPAPRVSKDIKKTLKFTSEKAMRNSKSKAKVSWQRVPFAEGYSLTLNGKKVSRLYSSNFAVLEMNLKIKNLLKVAATNSDGTVLSVYSPPQTIEIQKILLLPAPVLSSPPDEAKIITSGDNIGIFSWRPVKGATSYTFQVAGERKFSKILVNNKVETQLMNLNKKLDRGKAYYWRVKAHFGDSSSSSWSDTNSFKL